MFLTSLRNILTMVVLGMGGLSAALADCPEERVKVTVLAILASDQNKDVDPALAGLAENVRKMRPGLTGFRLAHTTRRSLEIGKDTKIPLVDKQSVTVTVERGTDKNNRVELTGKSPHD